MTVNSVSNNYYTPKYNSKSQNQTRSVFSDVLSGAVQSNAVSQNESEYDILKKTIPSNWGGVSNDDAIARVDMYLYNNDKVSPHERPEPTHRFTEAQKQFLNEKYDIDSIKSGSNEEANFLADLYYMNIISKDDAMSVGLSKLPNYDVTQREYAVDLNGRVYDSDPTLDNFLHLSHYNHSERFTAGLNLMNGFRQTINLNNDAINFYIDKNDNAKQRNFDDNAFVDAYKMLVERQLNIFDVLEQLKN